MFNSNYYKPFCSSVGDDKITLVHRNAGLLIEAGLTKTD